MRYAVERCIHAAHPSLPGHFPGNPVVPGVVLLEEILTAVRAWQPDASIQGFQTVKFLQPITPDFHFTISLEMPAAGKICFSCSADDVLLNTGTVILSTPRKSV